ncbi:PrgI family protein [Bifidobacterium biavatii]|uniref:PrgI family protein n=1 Tax=Bifidobacterium biavatii DSM 23969 TaxID=1437608 RepID=A0A086ZHV1_9BIFI|nr:PrgI family protein [Bifidobacterium biavatii]KFI46101.1 hypothetical protein BBIA_2064 [Bifidobacterium biavatii DSM 23969]
MLMMPVYREISTIEPKVWLHMTWRQLLALTLMGVLCGGSFVCLWFLAGWDPNVVMYVEVPLMIPFAAYGWWRPMGLMPEKYVGYMWRHYMGRHLWFFDGPATPVRRAHKPSMKER